MMRATILENQWIKSVPSQRQAEFLLLPDLEALYGGAAGGGKSEALLQAAAQYVGASGYAALILRRSYADLSLPGALMDRADQWWQNTAAKWNGETKTWHFPSGATITFGYLEIEKHKFRYKSAEFQFIAFDELTQFSESQYRYMFSRLRRLKDTHIPIRMRSGTNPGDMGHEWVAQRFVYGDKPFIPARVSDNPYLDKEEYAKSLSQLDHVTRAQLLDGDWQVRTAGDLFRRHWFGYVDEMPVEGRRVRYWDLAATEATNGKDPDWTAGGLVHRGTDGTFYIGDVRRVRVRPNAVEALIRQTAEEDGPGVPIYMEQEPGASGNHVIDYYRRHVLPGYAFYGIRPSGSKSARARPLSAQAEAGNVKIVRGAWNKDFLDEIEAFPQDGVHDDQVDVVTGAFGQLQVSVVPRIR